MMFYSETLRVVLATVHIPLAEVPRALTRERGRGRRSDSPRASCRASAIASPRLALAGLNPHAGEHGLLGSEETRVLRAGGRGVRERAASTSRARSRPTPSSSAPCAASSTPSIACYHDQGLIPVKMAAFGKAVNVTLGLPIVRTSVDHGTAFDIAGKGIADPASMIEAVTAGGAARAAPGWLARTTSHGKTAARSRRRRTSPRTARRSTTTTSSRRSRRASCCVGTEVKSIREGSANLRDSFARVEDGEVWIYNVHINPYSHRGYADHEPTRQAQAAAAPPGDPQADRQDGRAGHDARADAPVLQERARQGRAGAGQGQAGARQARDDQAARGRPRNARRGERAPACT